MAFAFVPRRGFSRNWQHSGRIVENRDQISGFWKTGPPQRLHQMQMERRRYFQGIEISESPVLKKGVRCQPDQRRRQEGLHFRRRHPCDARDRVSQDADIAARTSACVRHRCFILIQFLRSGAINPCAFNCPRLLRSGRFKASHRLPFPCLPAEP